MKTVGVPTVFLRCFEVGAENEMKEGELEPALD